MNAADRQPARLRPRDWTDTVGPERLKRSSSHADQPGL